MTDPEKFTKKSTRLIEGAVSEAQELGHTYVGSEHLLLSICADGTTAAAEILISNGVAYDELRAGIVEMVGQGAPTVLNKRYFTTAAKRIMELAWGIAIKDKKKQAAPEHLLAAMIRESSCSASAAIKRIGGNLGGICDGLKIIASPEVRGELYDAKAEPPAKPFPLWEKHHGYGADQEKRSPYRPPARGRASSTGAFPAQQEQSLPYRGGRRGKDRHC